MCVLSEMSEYFSSIGLHNSLFLLLIFNEAVDNVASPIIFDVH